ncbi:ABC transporter ATP-binding protein [Thermoflexibacter ruber]|uniref:Lipoprotein-releasing system ATP-binding protein n=1 Tax=Thermoflexibacter ruber TaxID=1003 RepID=A0A1I2I261_9BACT|nr:ABC transporter ATP-binding protein [Thermoflexibacter ruber]SFF35006.1 lipoprotein-releasing system ATP-binding protein [Thermoflexibacter ruber]
MLKAVNIHKSYNKLHVLKGIDLEVSEGEIVSIVGASGAGKSTLLHILGTLDRPDTGSVSIKDTTLESLSEEKLAQFRNQNIGFVFQFHNLLPEFTAYENICLPAMIGNRNMNEIQEKADYLMNMLGIYQRKNHKPSEMSGGEQQRTAVARALINSPVIIFADEPSGNLDSKNAEELHRLFFKLRQDLKQTFVIVTHNFHLADMADRKVEIIDGKIGNGV